MNNTNQHRTTEPSFSPLVQDVNHVVQKIFFRKCNNLTPVKFSRSALLSSARFFEFRALETWFVYKSRRFVGPELKFMSMRVAFGSGVSNRNTGFGDDRMCGVRSSTNDKQARSRAIF